MGDFLDRLWVNYHYLRTVRRPLDLRHPSAFTEKVQVAKLTWRSPRMVALADKVEAKRVVAAALGPEWVTPTLYAGAALPPRSDRTWAVPHVIKCNHRSGGNHFVRSGDPDWGTIERSVARQLSKGYGRRLAEWVYSQIKPQVLVEPYIGNPEVPPDYKLHLFGGKFAFTLVNWDRFSAGGMQRATFDHAWKRLPFAMSSDGDYQGDDLPRRPVSYEDMIAGAQTLAQGFPFARVDLYEIGGRPRFGEVTFYPQSGYLRMPRQHDLEIGAMWPAGVPT
jgi:hypothetical protein